MFHLGAEIRYAACHFPAWAGLFLLDAHEGHDAFLFPT